MTGFVLSLAVCIAGLALILEGLGTGGELMLSLMRRHAPSASTGLPEKEYAGMCGMITGFLGGSVDEFQYTWDGADGTRYLATAADPVKDQTDFLAQITYEQLCHLMFPIGHLPKSEVRRIALESHLPNAQRRDSQGICFLGQINYNDFIRRHLGERPGPIIELESGRKLGEHRGYWFHTIGQRKGLGLSGGPWYVVKKNVHDNVIYVSQGYGTAKQYGRTIHLDELHFISGNPWQSHDGPHDIMFKNRHTPTLFGGHLTHVSGSEWRIDSDHDVQGIAPGQFAVIYDSQGHLCYGSGVITG